MAEKRQNNNSFVQQAAILAIAGILARVLGFLYRIPLYGLIGDQGNAIYSTGYTVYNFFLIMSSAGLPAAISKLVAEKRAIGRHDEAHKVFQTAFVLSSVLGLVCMLVIYFGAVPIAAFFRRPESYLCLITLAPTVFIVAMMAVIRGYFQGMNNTVPTAVSQLIEQIFNAIFSVVLAYVFFNMAAAQADKLAYGAAGGTAGTGIGALAGFVFIAGFYFLFRPIILSKAKHSNKSRPMEASWQIVKNILKTSWPIIAGTAVFSITNLIDAKFVSDRLVVAGFEKLNAEALYGQLTGKYSTLVTLPVSISSALAAAAIPSIAASNKLKQRKTVNTKINTALRVSMLLSVPSAFGIGILGTQIMKLLFGNAAEGGKLLTVGFLSIIFLALTQIITGTLQAVGKIKVPVVAAIFGAIVKVAVNYTLVAVPAINIYGAVIGTTLCYITTSAINWTVLCKTTKMKPDIIGIMVKPAIASIAMAAGCYVAYYVIYFIYPSNTIATLLAILIGIVVYVAFMILIGGLKEEDIRMLPMGSKLVSILKSRKLI